MFDVDVAMLYPAADESASMGNDVRQLRCRTGRQTGCRIFVQRHDFKRHDGCINTQRRGCFRSHPPRGG